MSQLDIFEAAPVVEPITREARIVLRALRDCLSRDLSPWWRHVTKTKRKTIKSELRSPLADQGSDTGLYDYIIADVVDLFGHTSTYQIGNWCIGLRYYNDNAQMPEGAKGWDNAWSLHCLAHPSQIEWNARRKMWVPIQAEAA